jgi:hypothetical protein
MPGGQAAKCRKPARFSHLNTVKITAKRIFALFAPTARWQTGFQAPAGLTLFISARGFARPFLARAANSKRLQGAGKADCAALFRSCIHSKMSWWKLRKAAFSPH